tara:strand:+ start:172 stop:513 length:342 start_codon:yes stop_codon:yes gene_type:complete
MSMTDEERDEHNHYLDLYHNIGYISAMMEHNDWGWDNIVSYCTGWDREEEFYEDNIGHELIDLYNELAPNDKAIKKAHGMMRFTIDFYYKLKDDPSLKLLPMEAWGPVKIGAV